METIFSRKQLGLAFSVVLFLLFTVVSAGAFAGLTLTLPKAFYLLSAATLLFVVLGLALIIYLTLQRNE